MKLSRIKIWSAMHGKSLVEDKTVTRLKCEWCVGWEMGKAKQS